MKHVRYGWWLGVLVAVVVVTAASIFLATKRGPAQAAATSADMAIPAHSEIPPGPVGPIQNDRPAEQSWGDEAYTLPSPLIAQIQARPNDFIGRKYRLAGTLLDEVGLSLFQTRSNRIRIDSDAWLKASAKTPAGKDRARDLLRGSRASEGVPIVLVGVVRESRGNLEPYVELLDCRTRQEYGAACAAEPTPKSLLVLAEAGAQDSVLHEMDKAAALLAVAAVEHRLQNDHATTLLVQQAALVATKWRDRLFGVTEFRCSRLLADAGGVLANLGDQKGASSLLTESMESLKRERSERHEGPAAALAHLAAVRIRSGDPGGKEQMAQAMAMARSNSDEGWRSVAITNVAVEMAWAGDTAGALGFVQGMKPKRAADVPCEVLAAIALALAQKGDPAAAGITARAVKGCVASYTHPMGGGPYEVLQKVVVAQAMVGDAAAAKASLPKLRLTGGPCAADALASIALVQAQKGEREGAVQTSREALALADGSAGGYNWEDATEYGGRQVYGRIVAAQIRASERPQAQRVLDGALKQQRCDAAALSLVIEAMLESQSPSQSTGASTSRQAAR